MLCYARSCERLHHRQIIIIIINKQTNKQQKKNYPCPTTVWASTILFGEHAYDTRNMQTKKKQITTLRPLHLIPIDYQSIHRCRHLYIYIYIYIYSMIQSHQSVSDLVPRGKGFLMVTLLDRRCKTAITVVSCEFPDYQSSARRASSLQKILFKVFRDDNRSRPAVLCGNFNLNPSDEEWDRLLNQVLPFFDLSNSAPPICERSSTKGKGFLMVTLLDRRCKTAITVVSCEFPDYQSSARRASSLQKILFKVFRDDNRSRPAVPGNFNLNPSDEEWDRLLNQVLPTAIGEEAMTWEDDSVIFRAQKAYKSETAKSIADAKTGSRRGGKGHVASPDNTLAAVSSPSNRSFVEDTDSPIEKVWKNINCRRVSMTWEDDSVIFRAQNAYKSETAKSIAECQDRLKTWESSTVPRLIQSLTTQLEDAKRAPFLIYSIKKCRGKLCEAVSSPSNRSFVEDTDSPIEKVWKNINCRRVSMTWEDDSVIFRAQNAYKSETAKSIAECQDRLKTWESSTVPRLIQSLTTQLEDAKRAPFLIYSIKKCRGKLCEAVSSPSNRSFVEDTDSPIEKVWKNINCRRVSMTWEDDSVIFRAQNAYKSETAKSIAECQDRLKTWESSTVPRLIQSLTTQLEDAKRARVASPEGLAHQSVSDLVPRGKGFLMVTLLDRRCKTAITVVSCEFPDYQSSARRASSLQKILFKVFRDDNRSRPAVLCGNFNLNPSDEEWDRLLNQVLPFFDLSNSA
eukprot:gene4661-3358_t